MNGRLLVIAGSDSGGGAGIQADLKTAMALGGYAMTAITALTAQDTRGVHGVYPVPLTFLKLQIETALADPGADAVKTGMLGDAASIALVASLLRPAQLPFVLDPVMVAKGGARLMAEDAVAVLIRDLLPLATIVTPNLPEAESLVGHPVATLEDMRAAAARLVVLGARAVLLKGGHAEDDIVTDLLVTPEETVELRNPRLRTRHTHGTGCTLASAVAIGLAQGMTLLAAVTRARDYVQAAIAEAPGLGAGHGPLNHSVFLPVERARV